MVLEVELRDENLLFFRCVAFHWNKKDKLTITETFSAISVETVKKIYRLAHEMFQINVLNISNKSNQQYQFCFIVKLKFSRTNC